MRAFWISASAALLFAGAGASSAWAKTPKECNAEYAANKAAIKGAGQKKKDFIAACKTDSETIPGGTAAAPPAAAPAPAPTTTAAPAPPPATAPAPASARAKPRPAAPAAAAATGANQFTTEAQASSHCPGKTVVWLNTKSNVYHFAGTKNYSNTKSGAYMCEADATAAGDRASKTEKHP